MQNTSYMTVYLLIIMLNENSTYQNVWEIIQELDPDISHKKGWHLNPFQIYLSTTGNMGLLYST